jgi:hypothetical protein
MNKVFSMRLKDSPFRPGSDYDKLYRASRTEPLNACDFVRVMARKLGKSQQKIKFDVYILSEPNNPNNRGRCRMDQAMAGEGKLRFEEVA